ncbi:MAG TPA: hypothetical protein VF654_07805, partial [Pyrinomonadaceae bacterium]
MTPRGSAQSSAYTVTDVVAAAGTQSHGLGLDPCGRVVGQSGPAGGSGQHPFYWDGTQVTDIGTYNGGDSGVAYAVNQSGAVTGWAYNQFDAQHVFVWTA